MDITMCQNKECVKKTKCLRFMGKPDICQLYSNFIPYSNKEYKFKCEYFYGMRHKGQRTD